MIANKAIEQKLTAEKGKMLDQDVLVNLVEEKLKANGLQYKVMLHAPEGNCDKVSELRGNHIHEAAKALLLNVKMSAKHGFCVLAILPGDRKVDFDKIKAKFSARSADMAQKTKVEELLQCEIGRVPPFSFNKEVRVIVEKELVEDNKKIYFSPGRLDKSIEMGAADYAALVSKDGAEIFSFVAKPTSQVVPGVTFLAPPPASAQTPAAAASSYASNANDGALLPPPSLTGGK